MDPAEHHDVLQDMPGANDALLPSNPVQNLVLLAVVALALIAVASVLIEPEDTRSDRFVLYGRGEAVDLLTEGAPVVLGPRRVGHVAAIRVLDGRVHVVIELDAKMQGVLTSETRFVVCSLNRWLPGNLGVSIQLPTSGSGSALPQGRVVTLSANSVPEIPPGFWLVLLLLAGVLILTVVLFLKLRSLRLLVAGVLVKLLIWQLFKHATGLG